MPPNAALESNRPRIGTKIEAPHKTSEALQKGSFTCIRGDFYGTHICRCVVLRGGVGIARRKGGRKEGGTLRGKSGRNEREKGNDIRHWTLIDRVNENG